MKAMSRDELIDYLTNIERQQGRSCYVDNDYWLDEMLDFEQSMPKDCDDYTIIVDDIETRLGDILEGAGRELYNHVMRKLFPDEQLFMWG
jgi:hypothetical protein